MGYGNYSLDVAREARSSTSDAFTYQGYDISSGQASSRREVHPILNPSGASRECLNQTPIVVAMDVTRSRGNDSRLVYEKLPMFIGQLEMKGYVEGAAISFSAIGDATSDDQAPIQVGQFEADNRLDNVLSKFWLEEGGGGTGQESYELMAYYYARHTKLTASERGEKGYFFFVGDEGFYPKVSKEQVKQILGFEEAEDLDSSKIFEELKQKFHVFFIYPQKGWEERKADIDAEIKKRVEAAGGQYVNVDVRASLIWDNRNDLDLHCICPSGEEIYYGHKQSVCHGWLDVDRNVQGETTKPVENIRWSEGLAPKGKYKFFVQNYRFHEAPSPTPWRAEVEYEGQIKKFSGVISGKGEIGPDSNQVILEFEYDRAKKHKNTNSESASQNDQYAKYHDDVILNQWTNVIGETNILKIEDPNSILDVMLGAIGLTAGSADLESYIQDLGQREQVAARVTQTRNALQSLSSRKQIPKVQFGSLPQADGDKSRSSSSKRL